MAKTKRKTARRPAQKAAKRAVATVNNKKGLIEMLKKPADHRTTGLVLGAGTGIAAGTLLGGVLGLAALGAGVGYLMGHAAKSRKR